MQLLAVLSLQVAMSQTTPESINVNFVLLTALLHCAGAAKSPRQCVHYCRQGVYTVQFLQCDSNTSFC